MADKVNRRKWPFIAGDVPPDVKEAYTETWARLGFASERECTRHLIRQFIIDNKPK